MMHSSLKILSIRCLMLLCLALLSMQACTPLLPQAESVRLVTLKALESPTQSTNSNRALHEVMSVRVQASRQYDSNRLMVVSEHHEVLPYQGVRWVVPLPQLIAESWAKSLEQAQIAELAYTQAAKFSVRPAAIIHLRAFHLRIDASQNANSQAAQAVCEFDVTLEWWFKEGNQEQRRILPLNASAGANQSDNRSVLAACNKAHQQALLQAIEWLRKS
ncbi:MAG: ABC-type transport auxiliary lipoprotein family protein [Xanthomonadales bacterium]|nr:ABC-type transport auxiliary lipoprotein family protein [Xanthomonadales bacterium]